MEKNDKVFIKDILEVLYTVGFHEKSIQLEDNPKNIANVAYPGKEEVIASYSSRFLVKTSS